MARGGVNEKAQAARERKAQAAAEKKAAAEKAKEDAKWADNDKLVQARLERKRAEEAKRDEKAEAKAAKKALEEEELRRFQSNKKTATTGTKLTRAQIAMRQLEAQKARQAAAKAAESPGKASVKAEDYLMEPNLNHVLREQAWDRFLETGQMELTDVTGVDQAIAATTLKKNDSRQNINERALFQEFCDRQLPILREEQPGLKRSQYQERLWKAWQRSPENPRVNGTIN